MLSAVLMRGLDAKPIKVSESLWVLVYNHSSQLLKQDGYFCLRLIHQTKSLTSLGAFSQRASAETLCSHIPQFSITTCTLGGCSRSRWNKTNYIMGRSSNESVLKRKSGSRIGAALTSRDATAREGWDSWGPAENQAWAEPSCHGPNGQSPWSCSWRGLGYCCSQILLPCR